MGEDDAKSTKTAKPKKSQTLAPPEEEEVKPVLEEEDGGWKQFLWNSDKKEFLGRTGKSWLDITIFYIIFFLSLYSFFMLQWFASLLVIKHDEPYQQGKGSMLYDKGPGLTYRPIPDRDTNGISTMIWFNPGKAEGYRFWSNQLKEWFDNIPNEKKAWRFIDKSIYGPCDGTDPSFGYSRGEPCILLKLNRIYDWIPEPITAKPDKEKEKSFYQYIGDKDLVKKINFIIEMTKKDKVYIWCEGEWDHDKENLGPIEYFPGPYIEKKYFPFKKYTMKQYQSPFVMIKLKRPLPGALISIQCKAFAKNIDFEKEVGFVKFQVLIGGA